MVVEYNQADITGGVTIYERLEAPKRALIGFLIKHDVVKDEKGANGVLIGVIIVCILLVPTILLMTKHKPVGTPLTPDQMLKITVVQQ
jgi:hypothetical protein